MSARPLRPPPASTDEDAEAVSPKRISIADRIAGLKLDQKGAGIGLRKPFTKPEPWKNGAQPCKPEAADDEKTDGERGQDYAPHKYYLSSQFPHDILTRALARKPPPPPLAENLHTLYDEPKDYEQPIPPPLPARGPPPSLPPRRPVPTYHVEDQAPPPPPPPRRLPPSLPVELPTPPPDETEEPQLSYANQPADSCLQCRDFSVVDTHAAQFPRHTITSLDQLAYDLTAPFESETDKARALFTWMHHNIAYDAPSFLAGNIPPQGPMNTLRSGLAVCDGYAQLFEDLGERVGLQVHKVTGHGKGYGYAASTPGQPVPPFQSNHAWNCVLLDGDWRLIDSCWGAGVLEAGVYTQRFNPSWFVASSVEFGKRHYPTDPSFQLLSDEEGGPTSWEDYILAPEGPIICRELYDHSLSVVHLEPSTKYLQSGQTVSFHVFKLCEHMSTAYGDNYVYMIYTDGKMTPLHLNAGGGWSGSLRVPPKPGGDIQVAVVKTVGGKDAKGLGASGFLQAKGKKAMTFSALAMWKVV